MRRPILRAWVQRTRVPRSARHRGPPSPPSTCRPRERSNSTRRLLPHTPRGRGARPLARSQQPPGHSDARRTQLRLCTAGPPAPAVWTPSSARPTAPPDPRPRRPALGSPSQVTRLVARRPPLATTRDALTRTAEPTHSRCAPTRQGLQMTKVWAALVPRETGTPHEQLAASSRHASPTPPAQILPG